MPAYAGSEGREVLPDVAQRQRAQQRVADGVQQHVAVRMRDHAAVERDFYAAEDQPPALGPARCTS